MATEIGIRELLEAGVHFGHQTRRWNPKMRRFIFGERGGIHIIDLQKTERLLHTAQEFAGDLAGRGGTILFVGTKKQARDAIKEAANSCGMPYIDQRWLGGLLTNFQTISKRIRRLHDLRDWTESGTMELLPVARADRRDVKSATSSRRTSAAWPTCSARPTRCSWWTSRSRTSACARPSASRSRSSAWSTRTATRTPWTS